MNIKTYRLVITFINAVTIHPKAFWASESNNITKHAHLTYLILNNNNFKYITSGTFDPLINLVLLRLDCNKLTKIDSQLFVNINSLSILFISHNQLTQLPYNWLPHDHIHALYIFGNAIEYLSNKTFEGITYLYKIKLSLNNITIEYNTFKGLGLKIIKISDYKPCTCRYVLYLNTISNNEVCDNSYTKYESIREYLKEECLPQIQG